MICIFYVCIYVCMYIYLYLYIMFNEERERIRNYNKIDVLLRLISIIHI